METKLTKDGNVKILTNQELITKLLADGWEIDKPKEDVKNGKASKSKH